MMLEDLSDFRLLTAEERVSNIIEEPRKFGALFLPRAKDEALDARTAPAEVLRAVENVRDALLGSSGSA